MKRCPVSTGAGQFPIWKRRLFLSSSLYKTILFLMISAGVLSTPVLGDTLLQPQTQDPGIRQDINNPDRLAGDKAVTAGDYAVAVSFFKNYLEFS